VPEIHRRDILLAIFRSMAATPDQKRSYLLQADAAMVSLQVDIEKRRDNNLSMIQNTCEALHKCVDEQMRLLRKSVEDETEISLSLIRERRQKLATLANKLKDVSLEKSGFTEEQITEINKQYAELQCGIVEDIYKAKHTRTNQVPLPQLDPITRISKTTEVFLSQLDSVTTRIESFNEQPAVARATPCIELNNCSVEGIDVPKGRNSSFTVTLRDSKGKVIKGCANSIKVMVVATGKGIYEAVHIEELPTGSYLVRYTPKSLGKYQVTC